MCLNKSHSVKFHALFEDIEQSVVHSTYGTSYPINEPLTGKNSCLWDLLVHNFPIQSTT